MDATNEVEAMATIAKALAGLEDGEARRVLRWANDRFQGRREHEPEAPGENGEQHERRREYGGREGSRRFERISDLVDASDPQTAADRALVVGYWFQVNEGEESVTGQQVNAELKDLGHAVANITA